MGLLYEITTSMYSQLYVIRRDITNSTMIAGNFSSMMVRFAPRGAPRMARALLSEGEHTSLNGKESYQLIDCVF